MGDNKNTPKLNDNSKYLDLSSLNKPTTESKNKYLNLADLYKDRDKDLETSISLDNSTKDNIPFGTSEEEIQNLKALRQSTISTLGNNIATGILKTGNETIGGIGYLAGTTKALYNTIDPTKDAKITDITNNPLVEVRNNFDELINESFPDYKTTDEKENPLSFDNMLGTVGSTMIRDVVPFFASMYITGNAVGKILSNGTKLALAQKAIKDGGQYSEKGIELANKLNWTNKQVTQLVANNGEAMLEADQTSDSVYKETYDKAISLGSTTDEAKQQADIAKTEAFKQNYLLNMAILKVNNLETRGLFDAAKNTRKNVKELLTSFKGLDKTGKAAFILKKLGDPLGESFEELAQGGVSTSLIEQAKSGENYNIMDTALDSLVKTVERAGTEEGWLEIITSSLLSGAVGGARSLKESKSKSEEQDRIKSLDNKNITHDINTIEEYLTQNKDKSGNVNTTLNDKGKQAFEKLDSFKNTEIAKLAAISLDNKSIYKHIKDIQLSNIAYDYFETGLTDQLDSKIDGIIEDKQKELKESGKTTIEDFSSGKNISLAEYGANLKTSLREYENIYNSLDGQYNISNTKLRKLAFQNAILQTNISKDLKNPKQIFGKEFFEEGKTYDELVKERNKLTENQGIISIDEVNRLTNLQKAISSYDLLRQFEETSSDLDINNNISNYKAQKINNKLYKTLKDQFSIITNPNKVSELTNLINEQVTKQEKEDNSKQQEQVSKTPKVKTPITNTKEIKKEIGNTKNTKTKQDKIVEEPIDIEPTEELSDKEEIGNIFEEDIVSEVKEEANDNNQDVDFSKQNTKLDKLTYKGELSDTGFKIAFNTENWSLLVSEEDKGVIRSDSGDFNEEYNTENSNPNKLEVGTQVTLKKVKAKVKYDYQVVNDEITYTDKSGKPILREANDDEFDIEVLVGNNKVGNIHEVNWLLASLRSAKLNIQDNEDLVNKEVEKLTNIWEYFKSNDRPLFTVIESKGNGTLNIIKDRIKFNENTKLLKKLVDRSKTSSYPIFGTIRGNNIYSGNKEYQPNDNTLNPIINEKGEQVINDNTLVFIGNTANGSDIILPVNVNNIGDYSEDILKILKSSDTPTSIKNNVQKLLYLYDFNNDDLFTSLGSNQQIRLGLQVKNNNLFIRTIYLDENGKTKVLNPTDINNINKSELVKFKKPISKAYFNINLKELHNFDKKFNIPNTSINYDNYVDFLTDNAIETNIKEFGNGYIFKQPVIKLDYKKTFEYLNNIVTEEINALREYDPTESNIMLEEDGLGEIFNPIKETDELKASGLLADQYSNLSNDSFLNSLFVTDKDNNQRLSSRKQDLIKGIMLSQLIPNFINKTKSYNQNINDLYNKLNKRKRNLVILSNLSEDKYNNLDFNDPQFKPYNGLSHKDIKDLYNDFEFITKEDNFRQFIKLIDNDLKYIYGIEKNTKGDLILSDEVITQDQQDNIDEEGDDSNEVIKSEVNNSQNFDSESQFSVDPKKKLSWEVKMLLSNIQDKYVNYTYTKFLPFDKVFNTLKRYVSNNTNISIDNFIDIFKNSDNEILNQVADKFSKESEQNKNKLISALAGQSNNFIIQQLHEEDDGYNTLKSFNSNRNDSLNYVLDLWNEQAKKGNIAKLVNSELVINKEVVNELKDKFNKAKSGTREVKQKFVKDFFKTLNIDFSEKAYETLFNGKKIGKFIPKGSSIPHSFESQISDKGIFGYLIDILNKDSKSEVDSLWELNNPFKGDKDQIINILAKIQILNSNYSFSDNFRNLEGKNFWGYSFFTYLGKQFYNLKNNSNLKDILLKSPFSSTSSWLKDNKLSLEKTTLNYEDGLKGDDKDSGVRRTDMSKSEQLLSFLTEIQSKHKFNLAGFFLPTLSDKSTSPIINLPKVKVDLKWNNGKPALTTDVIDEVYNLIDGERKRIISWNKFKDSYLETNSEQDLINLVGEQYFKGANYFYFFPDLNNLVDKEGKTYDLESNDFVNKVKSEFLPTQLNIMIKKTYNTFKGQGIITPDKSIFDVNYYSEIKDKNHKDYQASADITINYLIFYGNYSQVIAGDYAQFYKGSVEKTIKEYQKRLAKDIAPGMDGNWRNNNYTQVIAKDLVLGTNNDYLNQFKAYQSNIEITDAQEYTTIEEHITDLFAYGKIDNIEYDRFIDKIYKSKIDNKDIYFTESELKTLLGEESLQPRKPVYVNNKPQTYKSDSGIEHSINKITYIKSSSFPLIPQLTKGFELDNVRIAMEKANINRLAFKSAVKAGATNVIDIFNDDKSIKNVDELVDLVTNNTLTLSRDGFRIQQEIPYDPSKEKIVTVSQMNKLIFDGILHFDNFNLNSNLYTGKELKVIKESVRKRLFELSQDDLFYKLGVSKDQSGELIFSDLSKLTNLLKDEALSRNYPLNDIESLRLDTSGRLIIPLGYNNSSDKFESILTSLISKIILQKVPGKSFIQGSSAGLNNTKTLDEIKDQSGIIFTRDFNPELGLQFINQNNGIVKAAQVLLPFQFKDKDGNLLAPNLFIDESGYLDYNRVPKELLELIGARIPNQGFSSQLPIQVVGFIPQSMGDLVIVPKEITKQMGSDFDIDKLYTYFTNYIYDTHTQSIEKVSYDITKFEELTKYQLQNLYKDIHWTILTDPRLTERIISSLDKTNFDLDTEAKLITESKKKNNVINSPLYFINQIDDFASQKAAKALVGLSSLSVTFNTTIQDLNIHLQRYDPIDKSVHQEYFNKLGNLKLSYLSNALLTPTYNTNYMGEKRSVLDNLVALQNAAVDNAKDPKLGIFNLNETTFPIASLILMLKDKDGKSLNLSYVTRFLSQPIIVEYVEELEKINSILNEEFVADKKLAVYNKLITKYKTDNKSNINSFTADDLENELKSPVRENQRAILDIYEELRGYAETLNTVQNSINSDTKSAGKDFFEVMDKIQKTKDLGGITNLSNITSILSTSLGNNNYETTELGEANYIATTFTKQLFGRYYDSMSDDFNNILKQFSGETGKQRISKDNKKLIWKNLKSFLFTNQELDLFSDNPTIERERLLFSKDNLANRLLKLKDRKEYKDNLLIQRLGVRLAESTIQPNLVVFNASKADNLDEQDIIRDFINLLLGNEEEQIFAKDLIAYSYLTSGIQNTINFQKFIPTSYLFTTNLKDIKLDNTNLFLRQLIQNNPSLTKRINSKKYDDIFITNNTKEPTILKFKPDTDYSEYMVDENTFIKYLSKYNNKTRYYDLWEFDETLNIYNKINTLGTKNVGFSEYDFNSTNLDSLLKYNQVVSKQIVNNNPIKGLSNNSNSPKVTLNTDLKANDILASLNLGDTKEGLITSLNTISTTSTNELYRTLVDILITNERLIPNGIKITTIDEADKRGTYNRSTNVMNISPLGHKLLAKNINAPLNSRMFENTILHETLHAETANIVKLYLTEPNNEYFKTYSEVKQTLDNLNKLYKLAKELSIAELEKAKSDVNTKGQFNSLASLSITEGFDSLDEFITYSLTDISFQKLLVKIKSPGTNKSLFDRLITILTTLYKNLFSQLGVNIKDSVLEDVVDNIITLIDYSQEIKDNNTLPETDIILSSKSNLNMSVADFMKTLSKEEREEFRKLKELGIIKTECE